VEDQIRTVVTVATCVLIVGSILLGIGLGMIHPGLLLAAVGAFIMALGFVGLEQDERDRKQKSGEGKA
jgi:membrane-bound ClpP family serine protease